MKRPPISQRQQTPEQAVLEVSDETPSAGSVRDAKKVLKEAKKQRKTRERQEQKRFTTSKRRRRNRILIALTAVGGVALFVLIGLFTPVMALKKIEVYGLKNIPEEQVQEVLQPLHGVPLALITDSDISNLLENFKQIERYSAQLIPPDTMSLIIVERRPIASIKKGEETVLIDAAGVELNRPQNTDGEIVAPLLVDASANMGSKQFVSAIKALSGMTPELLGQVASITADEKNKVTVFLVKGTTVFWGDASENALKAKVLETTIEATSGKEIKHIDISAPLSPVFK